MRSEICLGSIRNLIRPKLDRRIYGFNPEGIAAEGGLGAVARQAMFVDSCGQ